MEASKSKPATFYITAAMISLCVIATAEAFCQTPPQRLREEERVERIISGVEPDVYEIAVPAGRFFQIKVENTAFPAKNPLVFALQTSNGSVLTRADEISTIKGHGRISWVAETDMVYQLVVRRETRAYWTSDPQATYTLQLLKSRESKLTDHNIVEGEKAIREDRYVEAVNHFRIAGDMPGLAESLEQGAGYLEEQAQLDALVEALKIAGELGDRNRESDDLLQIAFYYSIRGDFQTALNYAYRSLAVAEESDYPLGQGRSLGYIAGVYRDLGDPLTALEFFGRALEINRVSEGPAVTTNALTGMANAFAALGQTERMFEYRRRAIETVHQNGNRNIEALNRNN